jgi:hypothetical protein
MKWSITRALAVGLLVATTFGVACSDDGTVDTDRAQDQAETSATQLREDARDAWASLRTDADRLIDELQTRNAPDVKEELLDRCRDTQEQFRESNDNTNADRVGDLCENIRDADPDAQNAWEQIKQELERLDAQIRS